MTNETGGPAFPTLPIQRHLDTGEILYQSEGITIRDYFAAKAMQGILASFTSTQPDMVIAAKASYRYADAMLKAREQ